MIIVNNSTVYTVSQINLYLKSHSLAIQFFCYIDLFLEDIVPACFCCLKTMNLLHLSIDGEQFYQDI
jgi:hypothetical protein